jgi:hypothetical protein
VQAVKLGRLAYGVDTQPQYVEQARAALRSVQPTLVPLDAHKAAAGG